MELLSAGSNEYLQLCHQNFHNTLISPAFKLNTMNLVNISLGKSVCAALYNDGSAFVWGNNIDGQLGIGDSNAIVGEPTKVNGLPPLIDIKCGHSDSIILLSEDGEIFTASKVSKSFIPVFSIEEQCTAIFGSNNCFAIGDSGKIYRIDKITDKSEVIVSFFHIPFVKNIKKVISLKNGSIFVLTNDGRTFSINQSTSNIQNTSNMKDDEENNSHDLNESLIFREILQEENVIDISGNFDHFLALTNNNSVYSSGENSYGQLGITIDNSSPPILNFDFVFHKIQLFENLKRKDKIIAIEAGHLCSLFLSEKGKLWNSGCLPFLDHKNEKMFAPEKLKNIKEVKSIFLGFDFLFIQKGGIPMFSRRIQFNDDDGIFSYKVQLPPRGIQNLINRQFPLSKPFILIFPKYYKMRKTRQKHEKYEDFEEIQDIRDYFDIIELKMLNTLFLSPKIMKIAKNSDNTLRSFNVGIPLDIYSEKQKTEILKKITLLSNGQEITVNDLVEALFFEQFSIKIENEELFDFIEPIRKNSKINLFNILTLMKQEMAFFSNIEQNAFQFVCDNFFEIIKISKNEIKNMDSSILSMILNKIPQMHRSNPHKIFNEDIFLDFLLELYADKQVNANVFEIVDFSRLSETSLKKFIDIFDYSDLNEVIWKKISNTINISQNHPVNSKFRQYKT
ncbi:hypothetical protein TRFO_29335 [Tritrichomonas foetus]|uniref:Uncharacterized protein n=1 Tax=Tritrichomonas foetus TaxID=1144522 RepID=A0A1J4JVY7_9EUKA|nr:hypothetical protein TRFO_29335 [Tritrichomonas foetus]|eukprot:OHT03295.1 hypothetical protein TRFO_29335 [Tritrichomonas foetus]